MHTIFFDFGNVVAFFDHRRALRKLRAFTDLSEQELFAAYYESQLEFDYETGRLTTDQFVQEAIRIGRLTCTREQFLAAYCDIFTANDAVCGLVPRLKPRYRLVLASNTNDAHSRFYRAKFRDTLQFFDAIVLSQEVGARKPAPAFYEACQAHAQCERSECVFIDDMVVNIEAASAFGWHGIVYREFAEAFHQLRALGVSVETENPFNNP